MARPKTSHCPKGHVKDYYNTYIDSKGWTQCKECARLRQITYRAKQREKGLRLVHGRWIKDPARANLLAPALQEVLHGTN